ncbi:MAG TPA: hypothetical protein VNI83_09075 [Vicinamibacterales bacterium]|nr:hypothetical protein [Vicinamibacterales bacterium]
MAISRDARNPRRPSRAPAAVVALGLAGLLLTPALVDPQVLDLCGCAAIPDLRPFDSRDTSTYPPGTTVSGEFITLPLPPDGILRFSSVFVDRRHIRFQRSTANAPVTILVAGDVTLQGGCCWYSVSVSGDAGSRGTAGGAGVGGLGGPGGYRGGDGSNKALYGSGIGGAGFGPGGGGGGTSDLPGECAGTTQGGQFFGVPELLPLLGGSGGGGGCSTSATTPSCSVGGGGGGGGALLIAANGTIAIRDYEFYADGGAGGGTDNGSCATGGAGGSGGAIRLVASRLVAPGYTGLFARGGGGGFNAPGGGPGRIRLESVDSSALTTYATDPAAIRVVGPTPLANPVAPSVTITAVGGHAVPAVPQGTFGSIDVVVPVPGATSVELTTSGVPGGTTALVTVKPRRGAQPLSESVLLGNCNAAGVCGGTAVFNLAAGAYVVEARATFQVP